MSVTVTPQEFKFVAYDPALIQRVAEELLASLGLADRTVSIEVDETTPLTRTRVEIGDTIAIRVESGAFEDTKRPRQQSEVATATSLGRVLLRVKDRLSGGFGEAPPDDELTLAQVAAWETYSVGRLERLGIPVNQQRWRYNFRNRHGFSDTADEAFDRLWSNDGLTWGELEAIAT
ncbi:MAG: hypothetical protein ABI894_13250 [Ilumatobacteraceae bacterium]